MAKNPDFFDRLQQLTETFLSYRRRKRRLKSEKAKAKNPVLDWVEAFLWAAGMVLLVNQYVFQAYMIPSGSMIDTLLIGDRVIVNKIVYGPEILPGIGKLPSPVKPKRNDIIIFENPSYNSKGTAFDIVQRIIFMLTLSFVDIDRDESGDVAAHFLIKRAAGAGGDWFVYRNGNMYVRYAGEDKWIYETDNNSRRGLTHKISRLTKEEDYVALEAQGRAAAYDDLGFSIPESLKNDALNMVRNPDYFAFEKARLEVLRGAYPYNSNYRARLASNTLGRYVPEGRILPLGDNRDNSRDGRYFGPVKLSKILGRGSIIFWSGSLFSPNFGRMGTIR